jgi:hypothetical protein
VRRAGDYQPRPFFVPCPPNVLERVFSEGVPHVLIC